MNHQRSIIGFSSTMQKLCRSIAPLNAPVNVILPFRQQLFRAAFLFPRQFDIYLGWAGGWRDCGLYYVRIS
jgi:hypothetical protein